MYVLLIRIIYYHNIIAYLLLLYIYVLGVIATGLCNYLQTIGQRVVPAEKAAIIYSLDPVYGGKTIVLI